MVHHVKCGNAREWVAAFFVCMIYADKCRLIDAERKYNPQGGSLFVCVITQGSLLSSATPGYRKYNRVAVVFHPLPAHRNEWDV